MGGGVYRCSSDRVTGIITRGHEVAGCAPDSANCTTPHTARPISFASLSSSTNLSYTRRAPNPPALPCDRSLTRTSSRALPTLFSYAPQYRHERSRSPARRERPRGAGRMRRWHAPPWRSVSCGRVRLRREARLSSALQAHCAACCGVLRWLLAHVDRRVEFRRQCVSGILE